MTLMVPLPLLMDRLKSLPPHRFDELAKALEVPEIHLKDSHRTRGGRLLEAMRSTDSVNMGEIQGTLVKFKRSGLAPIDLRLMSALFELSVARNQKAMNTLHSAGYSDQQLFDELAERMGAARICSSLFTKLADLMEEL